MNQAQFMSLKVSPECTVHQALEQLNRTAQGILLLVNASGVLLRTITDGDLRRAVLAQQSNSQLIDALSARAPVTVDVTATMAQILAVMDQNQIDHVPVLDRAGRPVDLVFRRELTQRIWLSSPHLGEEETAFVEEAFRTNWIAPLGPHVDAFERELAQMVGVKSAAALSSGTAAIHLGLLLLGVKSGDQVFCSSLTFVGSCNPILYCGAEPVFIDSEPQTWNMSPAALERALEWAKKQNRLPRCVVIVNLYGQSADMDALLPICQRYGVPVLEDAAESLGAHYKGVTSGSFGVLSVFSFNGNKIITTSGGGMLVSNDDSLIRHARKLSTQAREVAAHYEHVELGFNYRMSNVLAGIGRGQLKVLAQRVQQRRRVFKRYQDAFADTDLLHWMPEPEGYHSTRWLTCFTLRGPQASEKRDFILRTLERHSIEARPVWKPMHLQPIFSASTYFKHGDQLDVSAALFDAGICLPSGSNMSEQEIDRVIDHLRRALIVMEDARALA